MAEKQQEHRQITESTGLAASIEDTKRGQILGAVVSALAICGAAFAVYFGAHATVPIALVGVPLMAVIKAVIESRSN